MAEGKKSFVAYVDWKETFDALPDDKAGKLVKHLFAYVNDESPISDEELINVVFINIKQQLKRDLQKYERIKLRNKDNGAKGGRPKKKPKKPIGLSGLSEEPKKPDTDNDTDIYKYIYGEFYNSEIKKSENDSNYLQFVKILFGENNLKTKLECVLKMKHQLTYDQFKNLWYLKNQYKFSIMDVLEEMENWGNPKKNTTVYRTFITFIKNRNPEIKVA